MQLCRFFDAAENEDSAALSSRALLEFLLRDPERRERPCLLVGPSAPEDVCPRVIVPPLERPITIGRAEADVVVFDSARTDAPVSRCHAAVRVLDEASLQVDDLGSTNGTFFNGERVTAACARPGDIIELGTFPVIVTRGGFVLELLRLYSSWHSRYLADERLEMFSAIIRSTVSRQELLDEVCDLALQQPSCHHLWLGGDLYLLVSFNATEKLVDSALTWSSPYAPLEILSSIFKVFAPHSDKAPLSYVLAKAPVRELAPYRWLKPRPTMAVFSSVDIKIARVDDTTHVEEVERTLQQLFTDALPPERGILADPLWVPRHPLIAALARRDLATWDQELLPEFRGILGKLASRDIFGQAVHALEGILTLFAVALVELLQSGDEAARASALKQWKQLAPGTIGCRAHVLTTLAATVEPPRPAFLDFFSVDSPFHDLLRLVIKDRNEVSHGGMVANPRDIEAIVLCVVQLIDLFTAAGDRVEGWALWRPVSPNEDLPSVTIGRRRLSSPFIGVARCERCEEQLGYLPSRLTDDGRFEAFFPLCGHRFDVRLER